MGSPADESVADEHGLEVELVWRGKYDAHGRRVVVAPRDVVLTPIEHHGAAEAPSGELGWGDNLDILDGWLSRHRGAVDLAYIDPPFSTGSDFAVLTRVRDRSGAEQVLAQPAYTDRWPGGTAAYLAMLAPRLERISALLAPHGSLYVHVDPTVGHAVRLLLDEILGAGAFQREIIWRIGWVSGFKTRARNWIRNHDTILFYAKDPSRMRFNKQYVPHPAGYVRRSGAAAKAPGMAIDDVWNAGVGDLQLQGRDALDSIQIKSFSREKTGYATQKNESLLRRIVAASSNPGDLVLDAFAGAGTTAVVAAAMGRRFLACDIGAAAIELSRGRLLRAAPETTWSLVRPPDAWVAQPAIVEAAGARAWRVFAGPGDSGGAGPNVRFDVGIDRGGVASIELHALAPSEAADATVAAAITAGADPLREWAVDWAAADGPMRPSELRVADGTAAIDRRFESPQPLATTARITVQLVDLAFGRRRVELVVERARTWRLHARWW